MGFGFNLIGFPVLILVILGLFAYFVITRKKIALRILGIVWSLVTIVLATGIISDYYGRPIRLIKADIVGDYYIDTNFFPGVNAKWQFNHYSFTITPSDSLFFYITDADIITNTFKEQLHYSSGPPDLWTIQSKTTYHVIKHPPTLYRGHNKFYYVFKSNIYGNMFFRKVE